jgi:hypothetical protein
MTGTPFGQTWLGHTPESSKNRCQEGDWETTGGKIRDEERRGEMRRKPKFVDG